MDEIAEQSGQSYRPQLDKFLYWTSGIVLFIGIVTLAVILWLPDEIPENTSVFYWSYAKASYLVVPHLCILPTLILLIIRLLFKKTALTIISAFILIGVVVCHTYLLLLIVGVFLPSGVIHLDSVQYKDKTYHLAGECEFDGPCETALCECDSNGYWCKCHHTGEVGVPQPFYLQVDRGKNQIEIHSSVEGIIYRYNVPPP